MADLTAACTAFLGDIGAADGLLSIFVPHATAGLVIVEIGAGSDDDLLDALDRLLPREERLYRHRHGSPGHGADHVLPLLAPPSLTVPVIDGGMALGTWQSICLLDPNADNMDRTVRLSFLPAGGARARAPHAPIVEGTSRARRTGLAASRASRAQTVGAVRSLIGAPDAHSSLGAPADVAAVRVGRQTRCPAHRRVRAASPPVAGRRYTPAQPQADPAG